ncbi:MAG TPA: hypothetical protein VJ768_11650 [Anaerolineales bacterium]|nr:hypothetical protein [Anaerolineales bacterium]
MPNYICITCGNQFRATAAPPADCPVCQDERQYVNPDGQSWILMDELEQTHHNALLPLEAGLAQIRTVPQFAIGQRALLVQAPGGNVLWDCLSLIDRAMVEAVEASGGISALSASHPHMFGSIVEWSHAFGRAPVYLHRDFERWVQRPDPVIEYWDGESLELRAGVSLYRCGGHFRGSTVLHWPEGAGGQGVLLTSDTLHVTADRRYLGFMYSYPNYIPLSGPAVDRIVDTVMPLKFDRIYSHFHQREILSGAKEAVRQSRERYMRAIGESSGGS